MVYKRLCVGIVCGGYSSEHNISLQSATNIINHIDRNFFQVVVLWINKKGIWYINEYIFNDFLYNTTRKKFFVEDILNPKHNRYAGFFLRNKKYQFRFYSSIDQKDVLLKFDVVFPIVHGTTGEDGSLQGFFQILNLPYVGASVLSSSIGMDKDITKRLLRASGFFIAPFQTYYIYNRSRINFFDIVDKLGLPLFVKPANQGSSIGISKVFNYGGFKKALNLAFSLSNKVLIERNIIGRELECAVLGNSILKVSVCGEIILKNNFYTYRHKYLNFKKDIKIVIPADITKKINNRIKNLMIRVFRVLNCSSTARIDFFLTSNNQIIINEVNTLPGFTENSMYPKLWKESGLNFTLLITKLIKLAFDFHK